MNLFFKILLNLYFVFQCVATVLNFLFFLSVIVMSYVFYALGESSIKSNLDSLNYIVFALLIIVITQVYFLLTPISAISTLKIIQHKPLTKLQKFSSVIFPIITVPLYLYLIFKFAI